MTWWKYIFYLLFQNGVKSGIPSPIQSLMGNSAAGIAAAMHSNFVLFPFLDQLHHQTSGGFPSQLQTMQPFLQKNNVSSSCSTLRTNFSIAYVP